MMSAGNAELLKLTEKVRRYVMAAVLQKRYEHSVRTAEMCRKLCSIYGFDGDTGYFAGISHDMCKNLPAELLISIARRDGKPFSVLEEEKPDLLHGRAAAVKLQEDFDFHDKDVLEAVANHTFGLAGMNSIAKILFVADKIEPGRDYITEEYLQKLYKLPLNVLVKKVLEKNIGYLKKKGRIVARESELFLESLG